MARQQAIKKKPTQSPSGSTGSGTLLSFFNKSPSNPGQNDHHRGSNGSDVKPDISGSGLRRTSSSSVKGKEKAVIGSESDPVVISDDEDIPVAGRRGKKVEKMEESMPPPRVPGLNGSKNAESGKPVVSHGLKKRRQASPPLEVELVDDISMVGPSRPRSCSPPPPPSLDETERPPSIAGQPNFKVPPTWPDIINTSNHDGDDELRCDVEHDEQDDDSIVGREDGDHDEDEDEDGDGEVQVDGGDETLIEPDLDEADEIVPLDDPPDLPPSKAQAPRVASPSASSIGTGMNHLTLDMEWGEDAEEGMGMEDFGEEEGFGFSAEGDEPDDPVLGKRKSKKDAKGVAHSNGKGRLGNGASSKAGNGPGKDVCPVCETNLRGKIKTAIQRHINACLDNPTKGKNGKKSSKQQPISSFSLPSPAHSPAPSPSPPPEEESKGPNAFSVLMSGHKEREQWKDAEIDLKRDGKRIFGRRNAPFYKVLTGMPVAVDAFRYGAIPKVTAYLLSHAHSDHYTNLSKSWNHGPIYCSETTGNLIIHMLGVEPKWVHGLPEDIPYEMPNTGGVKVTVITANHCPGSSIFLFEGRQTVNAGDGGFRSPYVGSKRIFRYLHCGDFRACPKMVLHPEIARARIDTCYLDTTYLNPKYCFPPQPQVIEACAQLARKTVVGLSDNAPPLQEIKPPVFDVKPVIGDDGDVKPDLNGGVKFEPGVLDQQAEERGKAMMKGWLVNVKGEDEDMMSEDSKEGIVKREDGAEALVEIKKPKGRTLVVMGTYSIGKERIVKAVAKALGTTIYCDPRKKGILLCETDPDLHALLSSDPVASQVHLLPLGNIQLDRMQEYLTRLHPHFDRVLGFRPTGWAYSPPAGTDMMPDVNMVIRRDQARWFTDASLKPMRGSCRQYMMYGVPYSEHSSFFELTCFALSMPGLDLKMIATVNVGNEKSRAKMKKWFEKWTAEKAKRKEKGLPGIVDYRDVTYW